MKRYTCENANRKLFGLTIANLLPTYCVSKCLFLEKIYYHQKCVIAFQGEKTLALKTAN